MTDREDNLARIASALERIATSLELQEPPRPTPDATPAAEAPLRQKWWEPGLSERRRAQGDDEVAGDDWFDLPRG